MKDNSPLSPSNRISFSSDNRSVSISPVQRSDSGEYQCTYRNPVSSETTKLSLIINYGPEAVSIKGQDVVDLGVRVSLSCSANSEPSASFSWKFNETDTNVTTDTFTIDQTDFTHSGDYECTALKRVTKRSISEKHALLVKVGGGGGGGGGGGLSSGAIAGILTELTSIIQNKTYNKSDQQVEQHKQDRSLFFRSHTSPSPTTTFSVQQLFINRSLSLSLSLSLCQLFLAYFSELLFIINLHIFALFLPFSFSSWHIFKAQNRILIGYVKKLLILTAKKEDQRKACRTLVLSCLWRGMNLAILCVYGEDQKLQRQTFPMDFSHTTPSALHNISPFKSFHISVSLSALTSALSPLLPTCSLSMSTCINFSSTVNTPISTVSTSVAITMTFIIIKL
ncbi:carcinoembryonic antigen-related cell adhesion molecule 20-like [Onychostoma macrolepis]|uniref:carcinoembryonic antigen-related cell adhesion molecule 20-like n=1 Tax=Onychostoma macrolepis TaxID=369639 RepID=UPI00272A51BA|nr:carcinoembryonic antigen-related cell adhesion molecule 20-like [Onychostoma macrolepis]